MLDKGYFFPPEISTVLFSFTASFSLILFFPRRIKAIVSHSAKTCPARP